MAAFCKLFTTAKIRYFDQGEADRAQEWLVSEFQQTAAVTRQPVGVDAVPQPIVITIGEIL
jgi:hypothetical protein